MFEWQLTIDVFSNLTTKSDAQRTAMTVWSTDDKVATVYFPLSYMHWLNEVQQTSEQCMVAMQHLCLLQ